MHFNSCKPLVAIQKVLIDSWHRFDTDCCFIGLFLVAANTGSFYSSGKPNRGKCHQSGYSNSQLIYWSWLESKILNPWAINLQKLQDRNSKLPPTSVDEFTAACKAPSGTSQHPRVTNQHECWQEISRIWLMWNAIWFKLKRGVLKITQTFPRSG